MILADTGALYAPSVAGEQNHKSAAAFFQQSLATGSTLAVTQLIISESWYLIQRRQGLYYADSLWDNLMSGLFQVLQLDIPDLAMARQIRKKYDDSKLGFVDATSLAACEHYRISQVFTFDVMHFGIYRPSFAEFLELVPAVG